MDAQGWSLVIAAISLGVVQVIGAIFSGLAWYKGHVAATTAKEVKSDLAVANVKVERVAEHLETATLMTARAEAESKQRDTDIANGLVTVKNEINGKMAELLKVTGESERAKGVKEGAEKAASESGILRRGPGG